jgi:hypothetical protein
MTALAQPDQLAERLAHVRLAPFATTLPPGARCTPGLTGLPALADPSALRVRWSVHDPGGTELEYGAAFVAARGLTSTRADLVLRPEVVEPPAPPVATLERIIRATVTLTAPGARGEPVSATRVLEERVQVLALGMPTLLAMFRHPDFAYRHPEEEGDGTALLVSPAKTPLADLGALRAGIAELQSAVRALSGFARFATLSGRLDRLVAALRLYPDSAILYVREDALNSLAEIGADDDLSSMVLLGPANRTARCFIDRDCVEAGGRMDVRVQDDHIVLIPSLHAKSPATEPGGRTVIVIEPPGGQTFGDELSSLDLI